MDPNAVSARANNSEGQGGHAGAFDAHSQLAPALGVDKLPLFEGERWGKGPRCSGIAGALILGTRRTQSGSLKTAAQRNTHARAHALTA